jgi:putative ABC transport system permease protein
MRYLPMIWAALWRRPTTTVLTQLSIIAAFVLFGVLQRIDFAFSHGVDAAGLDVLHVQPKYKGPLPLSYLEQIAKVPGVTAVTPRAGMESYYRDPGNSVSALAVDPGGYFEVHRDYQIPPAQLEAFKGNRMGAAATAAAARAYGWKLGDRISLHSKIPRIDGSSDWSFEIVAIFGVPQSSGLKGVLVAFDSLDAGRTTYRATADQFLVRVADARNSSAVIRGIDRMFQNSPHETRTMAEKEVAQALLSQFGDLAFFTKSIVSAVFFTLLFLTVSTLMQAVRERIPELAILKAIGYSDRQVLMLVLAESLLMSLIPALVGLAVTLGLFALALNLFGSLFGVARFPTVVLFQGIGLSILIALASGVPPAWRASRLSVIDSLAGR